MTNKSRSQKLKLFRLLTFAISALTILSSPLPIAAQISLGASSPKFPDQSKLEELDTSSSQIDPLLPQTTTEYASEDQPRTLLIDRAA